MTWSQRAALTAVIVALVGVPCGLAAALTLQPRDSLPDVPPPTAPAPTRPGPIAPPAFNLPAQM